MTTRYLGIANLVMPDWRCTGHAFVFWDSIGLPGTDDTHIGEKVAFFEFSKTRFQPKQKHSPIYRNFERWEDQHL